MTLRTKKLDTIRKQLQARREALAQDLRQTTRDFIEEDPFFSDAIDQASADMDRSFALQLKNREREILTQIDVALQRMDRGEFGECERCGEEIADARIRAFPLTTLCVDCKTEIESEQRRIPVRG